MRIAYIGIDLFFPALQKLVECGNEIIEIFTCKTDNVTEFNVNMIKFANDNNIPYALDRITIHDFVRLKEKGCQAVLCAGYYYKIPEYDDIPTVNIHPTLLPYGRGSWPMPYDILNNRKTGGVTIHKVSEGFDEGDILLQQSFELSADETHETLMKKVYEALEDMLPSLTKNFNFIYKNATPQLNGGVYLPAPDKSMYTVSYDMDVLTADKILRAFYGYECYYVDKNHNEHLILKGRATSETEKTADAVHKYQLKNGYIVL